MTVTTDDVQKCLIVLGGFLCYFVADGCTYSFGILYAQALTYFGLSNYQTSWINALLYSVPQLLSPLVCSIGVAFGTPTLAYLGGVFLFLALLCIAFSTAIWQVYLSVAMLLGFGLESTYVASLLSVSNSFSKRRGLAVGIATSGSGLGGLSISTLTAHLFNIFSWQEVCAILAAGGLNVLVAGCLFRLMAILKKKDQLAQKKAKGPKTIAFSRQVSKTNSIAPMEDSTPKTANFTSSERSDILSSNVVHSADYLAISQQGLLHPDTKSNQCGCLGSFYRTFVRKLRLFTSDLLTSLKALFQRQLYTTNANFLLLCCVTFSVGFCVVTPLTYLYHHVELSLTTSGESDKASIMASRALSTMSLSTCAGVILLGALSDRLNGVALHLFAMTIVGSCTMVISQLDVTSQTYPFLLAVIAVFGVAYGASFSVAFILLIQFNGIDRFGPSLSILLLASGTANLCGTPIGGLLFDTYDSYQPAFQLSAYVLLSSIVLVVCLHLLLRFVVRVPWNMRLTAERAETTDQTRSANETDKESTRL